MGASAAAVAFDAFATDERWPARRPIRVITPLPAGGTGDVLAREFSQRLGEQLKQTVIVENKPGGNGAIATVAAARAPADGYTLLFTLTQHIQAPVQFKDIGYDPIHDFTPIARLGAAATVLVARPGLGVNSMADLLRLAPGKQWTFGTTATGPQVIMEVFNKSSKLNMLNVPYKGEPNTLTDLVGGQIDMALLTVATARGYIETGKLKALGVIAPSRAPSLPNVPTFLELGFKDVNWTGGWYGFLAPSKLPAAIATRLTAVLHAIVEDPLVKKRMDALDVNMNWLAGPAFGPAMKQDMETWASLVQRSGVVIPQ